MKKLLFLLFAIYSLTSYSQIFVNDIDKVAVVVIDYCVDEKGNRYNERINQEKSTYKDKGWQLGCLKNFKNSKLMYPKKMTNDCWNHVYYFVNEDLKTKSLANKEQEQCKTFHKGTYKYHNPAYINTKIIRRKKRQIEKSPDKNQRQVYGINWVDNHIYTLKTLKLPLEKDKHKVGRLIRVEIIDIIDENTYIYKSFITGIENPNVIYGLMSKVSN